VAHEGQEIVNPRTGQRMIFIELHDELLRIDSLNPPTPQREPVHVHPKQESGAEVLAGTLVFEVAGTQRRVGPGETIRVAANTPHRFWNDGSEDARSIQSPGGVPRSRRTAPRLPRPGSPVAPGPNP
jgi:quercetin dioxygenase-like cupin family protein